MAYIDISVGIKNGMLVWPGDKEVEVVWDGRIEQGHESNVSYLRMGAHVGTHLDMPLHFIPNGKNIENLDLECLIGPAAVVEVPAEQETITAEFLEKTGLDTCERVLFKTRNSKLWEAEKPKFDENYVALDSSGARWLVEKGCRLVGIDAMSIARFKEIRAPHEILLSNDVVVLETLDLRVVTPGHYELLCLPLKLFEREAAPVRAILRPLDK